MCIVHLWKCNLENKKHKFFCTHVRLSHPVNHAHMVCARLCVFTLPHISLPCAALSPSLPTAHNSLHWLWIELQFLNCRPILVFIDDRLFSSALQMLWHIKRHKLWRAARIFQIRAHGGTYHFHSNRNYIHSVGNFCTFLLHIWPYL